MNEYFFSKLNDMEQKCYRKILCAVERNEFSVNLGLFIKGDILKPILFAINYDHPELFYVDFKHISYIKKSLGLVYQISYRIKPALREMSIHNIQDEIDNIIKETSAKKLKTDYEKCRWIHNYLVKNIKYHFEAVGCSDDFPEAFEIDGVFNDNKAVCEGIAKAFKILCDKLGIQSLIVYGAAASKYFGQETLHAWNIVNFENQFMHIDVTWDIGVSESARYIRYDYFCISDKCIKNDHTYSDFPLCETDKWSYFAKRKRVFSGVKQLKEYLENELKHGSNILYFKIIGEKGFPLDIEFRIQNLIQRLVAQYVDFEFLIEMVHNHEQMCFFYRIKRLGDNEG